MPTTDLNADLSDEEFHTLDLLIPDAPRDSPKNALASFQAARLRMMARWLSAMPIARLTSSTLITRFLLAFMYSWRIAKWRA
jgi:hypothetical protein